MKRVALAIVLIVVASAGDAQNLISNGRFQHPTLQPRCDGWFNSCGKELTAHCDTNLYCHTGLQHQGLSTDPENIWSLKVKAGFPEEGFAETYITGQDGTHIYELKFRMKATDWQGGAMLGINTQGQFIEHASLIDTAVAWKQFSLTDTLTTRSSDTITIRLTAGLGDFCYCPPILFDWIELTRVGTISVDKIDTPVPFSKVYPNPTDDRLTIEVLHTLFNHLTLEVYNAFGQQILYKQTRSNMFIINKNEIGSGIFFYQLYTATAREPIDRGKIIIE